VQPTWPLVPVVTALMMLLARAIGSDADLTLYTTKARVSARAWKSKKMESTELLPPALAASECAVDTIRQNPEADNANESAINKAEIIAELENMVAARLLSGQPWLADRETFSAINRKLIQMGLWEEVGVEPQTWRTTPLGKELHLDLFQAFMGVIHEWDVPLILEEYGLIDQSEFDAIIECTSEADAESLLERYVKRAYFDYRKAAKFLH
jgi:hypothetical protein